MGRIDYRAIEFGLALGHAQLDPQAVTDFLSPGVLDALEMPAECFLQPDPEFQRRLNACEFKSVSAGSLMASDLTRTIPFVAENYRRDFAEQAGVMVRTLVKSGAHRAFLGFDLGRILGNTEAENAALDIIHRLIPTLYRDQFELLIPFRVPFHGSDSIRASALMGQFLRGTLTPLVKLSLEIHPFEVKPEEDKSEMVGMLPCEARQAVLIYDADCGNHITAAQFRPWAEHLATKLFRGRYLLCPRSIRNRMLIPEADLFAKMVSDLRNE